MKKNWKKRGITLTSILLLAVFFVTLMPVAAFAKDGTNPPSGNSENNTELTGEWTVNTGSNVQVGHWDSNANPQSTPGSVGENASTGSVSNMTGQSSIGTNNGSINNMYAENTVGTNNGSIGTNQGVVTTNGENGTITTNQAQSGFENDPTKSGGIVTNNGTVTTNANSGTVTTNGETGTVTTNNGKVTTNNGTVTTNGQNGTITTNSATGTVSTNRGTVVDNYGTVNNTGNGSVTNNYGGTVTGTNTDTVTNYYEVIAEGGTLDGAVAKNGTNWGLAGQQEAAVTATFDGEADVVESGAEISTSQDGGKWIYKLFNITSKVKLVLKNIANGSSGAKALEDEQVDIWALWAAQIRAAAQGASLVFEGGIWPSINVDVAQALADRSDVSVTFNTNFVEGGSVTIPAGTDVLGMIGNKGVITFADLAAAIK